LEYNWVCELPESMYLDDAMRFFMHSEM